MQITPDATVFWQVGALKVNATLAYSWAVMVLMVAGAWLVTRRLTASVEISRGQNLLEAVVEGVMSQIREVTQDDPREFLPFIATLFLFIAVSNTLDVVPGFSAPTGSLSTTAALAVVVFFAVHYYGVSHKGLGGYLRSYLKPTPVMLPFNVIGELSRTLALAVRLFGNMMSGTLTVAILLSLAPLVFPAAMQVFGLLIGLIQAYIFTILAMVYIASAVRTHRAQDKREAAPDTEKGEQPNG